MTRTLFDDSLPRFAALVQREWGATALAGNLFLRDVGGRLTFVVRDRMVAAETRAKLAQNAENELAPYVDENGFSVSTPSELYDDSLDSDDAARTYRIATDIFNGKVRLVDRRLVGADWLRTPARSVSEGPVRVVFASIKGGVGRSTALCVTAAHLASLGKRVLAIDMDLEAPGLGNMLLPGETLPDHGLLDYLVEDTLGGLGDEFFVDLIGSSWLGGGRGRVDVIPAIGRRSLQNPENVLAKIARAYLSGGNEVGKSETFADRVDALVRRFSTPYLYDAILVDARAGLHETTAAAVVGLGAEVFFFGIDQSQTYAGYELLLAHLGALPVDIEDDWRDRLQFVQAKTKDTTGGDGKRFVETMTALAGRYLWSSDESSERIDILPLKDTFDVEWVDDGEALVDIEKSEDVGVRVSQVFSDPRYATFEPITDRGILEPEQYLPAFEQLTIAVVEILDARDDGQGGDLD